MNDLDVLERVRDGAPAPSPAARARARHAIELEPAPVATRTARHHLGRRVLAAAAALTLLAGGAYALERHRVDSVQPQHVITIQTAAPAPAGAPENFLLVGSDSRALADGTPDPNLPGQRSDTIVVVRVDPGTKKVLAVSIPRDLFVDIPGDGTNKINSAYSHNLALLVSTIQQSLGVPIQHVMEVRFADYAALVDDLGGIRIAFPVAERDRESGLIEPAGCRTLDGIAALSFVRSRHTEAQASDGTWHEDPASDFGRMRRQQLALRQMLSAAEAHAGVDPSALLTKLFAHVTVDDQFTAHDALDLVGAFRGDRTLDLLTLPTTEERRGDLDGLRLAAGGQAVLDALAGKPAPASSSPSSSGTPTTLGSGAVPPITEPVVEQPC